MRKLRKMLLPAIALTAMTQSGIGADQTPGGSTPPKATAPKGVRFDFQKGIQSFESSSQSSLYANYKGKKALVCYQLVGDSKKGYFLTPATTADINNIAKCWDRDRSDDETALTAHEKMWIAIHVPQGSASFASTITSIYVNVNNQPANPIQITPIRPSVSTPPVHGAADGALYYFRWPYALQGDTVPTIDITAYTTATGVDNPGAPYDAGSDTFPQVHQLSRFNISTAVVYSTVRTNSFGYSAGTPSGPIVTGHSPIIDPVVFLTYYPIPIDAERPFHWDDELKPGISLGFSASNPTSNFYFGIMSEFPGIRNVELVYGVTVAKINVLATGVLQPAASATSTSIPTPVTVSKYSVGGFAGVSFNVSGFLSSLFKGG